MRKFATNLLFCTSISFTDVWNIQNIWKQNRLHISWNSWILNGKDKNRKSYLHSKSLCIRLDRGFYLNLALYIVCLFVFYSFFFFFWRYTDNGNTWTSLLSCRPISVVVKITYPYPFRFPIACKRWTSALFRIISKWSEGTLLQIRSNYIKYIIVVVVDTEFVLSNFHL